MEYFLSGRSLDRQLISYPGICTESYGAGPTAGSFCFRWFLCQAKEQNNYASVNSKHQHPPELTPGEFFKEVNSLPPGRKFLRNYGPGQKKIDKNPVPGDNFVDLQDNFAMVVKPFAFFWYSSLTWLSSSFFKDYKACEYKISQ